MNYRLTWFDISGKRHPHENWQEAASSQRLKSTTLNTYYASLPPYSVHDPLAIQLKRPKRYNSFFLTLSLQHHAESLEVITSPAWVSAHFSRVNGGSSGS